MRSFKFIMLKRFAILLTILAIVCWISPSITRAEDSTASTSSLIVKMVTGLSPEQQAEVIAGNGGIETSSIPALRLHIVEVPTDQLSTIMQNYQVDPRVVSVEENKERKAEGEPSDTDYGSQWALPKIGWNLVFDSVAPSGEATVAILDTGVDSSHPELAGKLVTCASILNGSVCTSDPKGHGTWMAGIVAANTDNNNGIAGVGYAGVKIMPVTVLSADGTGQDSDIIAGVVWAADHGADVILMGFSNPGFSQNLQDAIDYAWDNDVVLVAATGNDGISDPTFPAGDRGVIGVSATDSFDSLASFSNYGQDVFLAAPGIDIETTGIGNSYVSVSGTSSSAAIVAGVAAFMRAVDPTLTNGTIVGRLARNADPAGDPVNDPDVQLKFGNGRINMARALADTSMEEIQPAGAEPVGDGGPYVGPYVVAANAKLTVTVTGNGHVDSSPSGIDNCRAGDSGAPCFENYTITDPPLSVNLTATADSGSSFLGWSGSECTGTGTCNVAMSIDRTVTATFSSTQTTSLSVASASGTYGGTVNLSATLTTSGGSPITGKRVSFTLNGSSVGNATTNASGIATLNGVSLSGINVGTYPTGVGANFAGDALYSSSSDTAQLTVTAKTLTVTGITANNKEYNGNTTATLNFTSAVLNGVVGSDDASLNTSSYTATFANKNVANGISVTVSGLSLSGAQAGNYTLTQPVGLTANITAKNLTVTGITANNKEYDGNTTATLNTAGATLVGVVGSDTVTLNTASAAGTFDNKNVGNGKTVTVSGLSLSGTDAGNYTVSQPTGLTANITKRPITVTAATDSKTYDGTTSSSGTPTITLGSLANGDTTTYSQTFDNRNVGTNKTLTPAGSVSDGNGGNNYAVTFANNTTGVITARSITVTAATDSKPYDGTTSSAGVPTITVGSLASGDTATWTQTFDNKNVGTGKTLTPAGLVSDGNSGNNYAVTFVNNSTGVITPRALTVSATGVDKVYDGNTTATVNLSDNRVSGDQLTTNYPSASFADKNVGTGKLVSVSGISISGTDAGNYTFNTTASTTADITARALTVTADAKSKVYGDTDPALTYQITSGSLVNGDTFTGSLTRVAGENVGTYAIQIGTLALSSNYNLTYIGANLTISAWTLYGFYQPVDMPNPTIIYNTVKNGSTVPLKFEIFAGSTELTNTSNVKSLTYAQISCELSATDAEIDPTALATGGTVLRYDTTDGQFIFNWKTPKTAGMCCRVTMTTLDGSSLIAYFKLK